MDESPLPRSEDAALVALIPVLTPLARRLGQSPAEAEDLLQDALTAILVQMRAGAEIACLRAYGRMVLKNAALRYAQRPQWESLPDESLAVAEPSGEGTYAALEAVANLPERQARLVRGALEGHETIFLARAEGIAPGTVHSRLARARAQLRSDLDMS